MTGTLLSCETRKAIKKNRLDFLHKNNALKRGLYIFDLTEFYLFTNP